jgi:hypothetical protein
MVFTQNQWLLNKKMLAQHRSIVDTLNLKLRAGGGETSFCKGFEIIMLLVVLPLWFLFQED